LWADANNSRHRAKKKGPATLETIGLERPPPPRRKTTAKPKK
jgi:hypothetical protein